MIRGRFGEIGELIFDIKIIAADGELYSLEVLLDTGFTTGWLALDFQDAESLGWPLIQKNRAMQMARGEDLFDNPLVSLSLNQNLKPISIKDLLC
ncbi:MAG TPA: hypothetical protein VK184_00205 [Nostocaceae cyanobacterium]|nr:hypothetical protein [Nostocaceae cyanobacterium]